MLWNRWTMKASGLDGFTVEFYQQNWEIVGTEVCATILKFFNCAKMEESVNSTNIVLIPKSKHPSTVSEFQPISFCTIFYKLISNVLANWLKNVLPHIISCNQSAFIPGQLISNNILVAYKTLHTMHTCMWSKVGYLGIKLDMSKAYDRVEWSFLEAVMFKLGFDLRWIMLNMECVTTVRYAVVVNGSAARNIVPTRGIR